MSDSSKEFLIIGAIGALILSVVLWIGWVQAGVQQEVYRRQGVHMTRWEIFMDAKPVVRQVIQAPAEVSP